jgi:hypothetical protein
MNRPLLALLFLSLASLASCGGPAVQSAECKKMIDCAEALQPGSGESAYGDTYGVDGTCWYSSGAAAQCTATCQVLLRDLAGRADAPAVCR